jgi:hypothetical protein
MNSTNEDIRKVLQRFQAGYTTRDLSTLDEFMTLFHQSDGIELIGIGASVRGGNEWFQGMDAVREIIESDWTYWGDVVIDVDGAKITVHGDVAWLSASGTLAQTDTFTTALPFYLNQMKELLEDEDSDPDARMMEATHFGLRRLRERQKGLGFAWPFVLTAVLVKTKNGWRFHTIHWSMPVD